MQNYRVPSGRSFQIKEQDKESKVEKFPGQAIRAIVDAKERGSFRPGFIGQNFSDNFRIRLSVPQDRHFVFTSDKNGHVTPLMSQGRVNFFQVIPVKKARGPLVTKWPTNVVKVALFPGTKIEIWEIAIVSQHEQDNPDTVNFFLTQQLTYSSPMFNHQGQVVAPDYIGYHNWSELRWCLEDQLKLVDVARLPHYRNSDYKVNQEVFPAKQGRVIWFNLARNFGIVATTHDKEQVNALAHWSEISRPEKMKYLNSGELIHFDSLSSLETGGFPFQLKGIYPLSLS